MKAPASATASSAISSAAACCCISSTAPASTPAKPTRPCAPSSRPMATARRQARDRRAQQGRRADARGSSSSRLARLKRAAKKTPLVMSAVTGEGVREALRAAAEGRRRRSRNCRRTAAGSGVAALTLMTSYRGLRRSGARAPARAGSEIRRRFWRGRRPAAPDLPCRRRRRGSAPRCPRPRRSA